MKRLYLGNQLHLSTNWISVSNEQEPKNNIYFIQICADAVKQVKQHREAYLFTQEQVEYTERLAKTQNIGLESVLLDGCYMIKEMN